MGKHYTEHFLFGFPWFKAIQTQQLLKWNSVPDVNQSLFLFFFKREFDLDHLSRRGFRNICNKLQLCMWMSSSHKYHNYLVRPYNYWRHVFKRWCAIICPAATTTNAKRRGLHLSFSGILSQADPTPKRLFIPEYVPWRKQPIPTAI